jgi:hypothetical protein
MYMQQVMQKMVLFTQLKQPISYTINKNVSFQADHVITGNK